MNRKQLLAVLGAMAIVLVAVFAMVGLRGSSSTPVNPCSTPTLANGSPAACAVTLDYGVGWYFGRDNPSIGVTGCETWARAGGFSADFLQGCANQARGIPLPPGIK